MWVRLDDSIVHHPKFVRCGPEAFALFVAGLCYCNRYETDGLISKVAVPHLLPGIAERRAVELAERLAANGVRPSWVDEGEHFRVHDYELYQLTRDDRRGEQRQRELAAERKRRQRARERDRGVTVTPDGSVTGVTVTRDPSVTGVTVTRDGHVTGVTGERDSHANQAPLPGPLPPPRPVLYKREFFNAPVPACEAGRDLPGEFRTWFAAYPRQEGEIPALHAWLETPDLPPVGELLAALEAQQAGSPDATYWRKAVRYLRELGWKDQPLPPRAAGGTGGVGGMGGARKGRPGARGGSGGAWEGR